MHRSKIAAATALPPSAPLAHRLAHHVARLGWRRADAYWAVAERLGGQPHLTVTVGAGELSLRPDDIAEHAIYRGTYENAELAVVDRLVSRGGVCVDVGANIGLYTLFLASRIGTSGRVVSFEPSAHVGERLRQHVSRLPQVTVLRCAVGAEDGEAELAWWEGHLGMSTLRGNRYPDPTGVTTVPVQRLDDTAELMGGTPIQLLKVDVEGFEQQVFDGSFDLLASGRIRAMLIEVSPEWGPVEYAQRLLDDARYLVYEVDSTIGRTLRRLPILRPIAKIPDRMFSMLAVQATEARRLDDLQSCT